MVKHKDTKAQRHKESRHQMLCSPAFFVPLCLGVFVFNKSKAKPKLSLEVPISGHAGGGDLAEVGGVDVQIRIAQNGFV